MVLDRLSPLAVVALAHDRVHAGQPSAAICQSRVSASTTYKTSRPHQKSASPAVALIGLELRH
jgi:hypothetical protein